jgi:hypothetical protein
MIQNLNYFNDMIKRKKHKSRFAYEIFIPFLLSIFLVGYVILNVPINPQVPQPKQKPIVVTQKNTDTLIDVSGKKVLFIGDSHSVYANGWQHQLCSKTKMTYKNTAVGGKRTDWMVTQLLKNIDSSYDYCFIWGGANDAASYTTIESTINNIQKMVNTCLGYGVIPIVLTGFDPRACIDVSRQDQKWSSYPEKYVKLQNKMLTDLKNCTIIKNHFVSKRDGDCGDFICHMSASGHRKMANGIINNLKFKTFN